ncbi:hypothetical protein, conserved [Trypanosoma brucei gambiense DAL972]|nr:hypothetical protein, conserved [Trypanosoma brucei gambiense DAL972]CBH14966.1 hypothetical protein, conserved [Trypanosoma brucei gambiense DAL972]|eukprot:XP_011777232.1 hypothetical protein, conserved [Trypanosoma brucei gambiense DAL972]
MSADGSGELPPVMLHRYPVTLGLPTADPYALAIECMLRIVGAHYKKRDGGLPVTLEVPVDGRNKPAMKRHEGLTSCLQLIESATHQDAEVITSALEPEALCVRLTAEVVLIPAFVYITHSDAGILRNAIQKAVEPKVASMWQRFRGSYSRHVVQQTSFCRSYKNMGEAIENVERCLRAIEAICSINTAGNGMFILGTERPCSADALIYAAASSFFHADFASRQASGDIIAMQQRLREGCPTLLTYVERLRGLYFEDYSAFYHLRAPTCGMEGEATQKAAEETFVRGRWKVLAFTGVFSITYFLVANIDVFSAVLLHYLEDDGEEEFLEDEE